MRLPTVRRAGICLTILAVALLAACGSQTSASPSSLGIPDARHPAVLGRATFHTSPDGGIYDNPDPLQITLVGRISMRALAARLDAQHQWAPLARLGALTVVGFQIHNAGLAGSDPQLNDLQIASNIYPPGTPRSTISRFYYPAFPLAGLSTVDVGSQCQVHLDPRQTITVVLVYPPIRSTTYVRWGEYGVFALNLSVGGGIPHAEALKMGLCTPPQAQPT